jgi:signal transduction histidine kinase
MADGGRLSLVASVRAGDGGGTGVVIEVRDTGQGISPETLASVGQPFFTTRSEGTGLGVATARRFVEQHGGRLELTSAPGAGTTVRLWVPAA